MKNTLSDVEMLNILNMIVPNEELQTLEVRQFLKECIEMIQLYAAKNHDYGNSFEQGMNVIGDAYGIGRLYDKMNRLLYINKGYAVVTDETITDTVRDLACYSVMLNCYYDKEIKSKMSNVDFEGE